MRLLLASASPRRAELLRAAGYDFAVLAVDIDEQVRDGEAPDAYVQRLASEKSLAAQQRAIQGLGDAGRDGPDGLDGPDGRDGEWSILGADTAVVVDGLILGKPVDDADAERMLRLLSGRTHEVLTAISVRRGPREVARVERTRVTFIPLRNLDIQWHVQLREGMDKAGGYAIQGLASRFIPRIDGSYGNVVGLPVSTVAAALAELDGVAEVAEVLNGRGAGDGNP